MYVILNANRYTDFWATMYVKVRMQFYWNK